MITWQRDRVGRVGRLCALSNNVRVMLQLLGKDPSACKRRRKGLVNRRVKDNPMNHLYHFDMDTRLT